MRVQQRRMRSRKSAFSLSWLWPHFSTRPAGRAAVLVLVLWVGAVGGRWCCCGWRRLGLAPTSAASPALAAPPAPTGQQQLGLAALHHNHTLAHPPPPRHPPGSSGMAWPHCTTITLSPTQPLPTTHPPTGQQQLGLVLAHLVPLLAQLLQQAAQQVQDLDQRLRVALGDAQHAPPAARRGAAVSGGQVGRWARGLGEGRRCPGSRPACRTASRAPQPSCLRAPARSLAQPHSHSSHQPPSSPPQPPPT
jgi:hypothetical protein